MREQFITKKFGSAAKELISVIDEIMIQYDEDGYDLSLRQLYYQLVSKNVVENTEKSYKNVGSLVSDARMCGLLDWSVLKDRGRETVELAHWSSPKEILESAAHQYRINRWGNQPNYVEVMVEKQALEGVIIPVCREWDVPFTANKGYSSSSSMYETSKRLLRNSKDGKELFVLYLGDHDPSGIDMTRDVEDRLRVFCGGVNLSVRRLALNMAQVRALNPPENPAKLTDSRSSSYVKRFGMSSWELDAIEPKQLTGIVSDAIKSLVDIDLWEQSATEQQHGRDHINDAIASWEDNNE